MMQPKITDWHGIYDLGWGDLLCPESYSHPAKMARGLVFKIVEYLLELEQIRPGQTIVDPFGGIGTTALPTLLAGLNYVGVELEQKFVDLGRQNIEMWNQRFAAMPKWNGTAVMLQGDSRRLVDVVTQASGVVSSPPYANSVNQSKAANDTEARIERMRQTGIDVTNRANVGGGNGVARQAQTYGDSDGQLGAMPEGDISAVVSSPPWAGNSGGRGEASRNGIDPALFDRHQGGMVGGIGGDGNLAGMRPGEVEAVIDGLVSSPPYEGMIDADSRQYGGLKERRESGGTMLNGGYGQSAGQLGTDSGDTFWAAAHQILTQCAAILPPGAPAVWVVKGFVRSGQIVDFPGQWQALCEACGFETVEIVRAWLVKDKGTQIGLNGEAVRKTVERKSFFRRIAERNGAPRIDYEIVLFTKRSESAQ